MPRPRIPLLTVLATVALFWAPAHALVLNEILADPPLDISGDANGDGVRDGVEDEFVEFVNETGAYLDIAGWMVFDSSGMRHAFPSGTILAPGECVVVFGGGTPDPFGTPAGSFGGAIVQTASSGSGLSLNNSGDSIIVNDGFSDVLTVTYGAEGGNDQSLVLDPEVTGTGYIQHTAAPASIGDFSPGLTAFGGDFPLSALSWFADVDQDGFGDPYDFIESTTPIPDRVLNGDDCDDADDTVHPGADELTDGQDNDCDGQLSDDEADYDGDGFIAGFVDPGGWDGPGPIPGEEDCDDGNIMIYPGAVEVCGDGLDNDCNGVPDDGLEYYYPDADFDGFGDAGAAATPFCTYPGSGWVLDNLDCDDTDDTVYPGAVELMDGQDNDCDGYMHLDEADIDWDAYIVGEIDAGGWDGPGAMFGGGDCDDFNNEVNPGADEICNEIDDNCDDEIDEGCAPLTIAAITDVPGDQGRAVRLSWTRSVYDEPGAHYTVTGYGVFRRIDAAGEKLEDWDSIGWISAHGDEVYNFVSPTVCDSTDAGICWSVFFIRATTADPFTFFDTPPDSGYSVDNLFPAAPTGLLLADGTLSWDEPVDADFAYFTVYGASGPTPADGTILGQVVDPSLTVDPSGHAYLLVTATDASGNESEAGVYDTATHADATPTAFRLLGAVPNPFNPSTEIRFELPAAARVDLTIYDAAGRLVRRLARGVELSAGVRSLPWDGADDAGRTVPAGVYVYRLKAGGETGTGRMMLVK